jgi:hypothetical protein
MDVFVVEILGKSHKSTGSGAWPGQPASQPAGPARGQVDRMADRDIRSLLRLDRIVRRITQFFAQHHHNT